MKVVLFLIIHLHGGTPVTRQTEMPNLKECLTAVEEILIKTPPGKTALQAGCIVHNPGDET